MARSEQHNLRRVLQLMLQTPVAASVEGRGLRKLLQIKMTRKNKSVLEGPEG